MNHNKFMKLCYCAAGRAEPRGAKRAQLKNVAVAREIVRSAKQLLRNVCAASPLKLQQQQMSLWLRHLCVLQGWLFVSCCKRRRSKQLLNTTTLARLWLQPWAHFCFWGFLGNKFCVELEKHCRRTHNFPNHSDTMKLHVHRGARVDARANTHKHTKTHSTFFLDT